MTCVTVSPIKLSNGQLSIKPTLWKHLSQDFELNKFVGNDIQKT